MKALLALWPYVRRYRWRFAFGILFVLLANLFAVRIPAIVGQAINSLELGKGAARLGEAMVYLIAIAGLAGCFRYLMRRVLIDTSRDIEFDFRNDAYRRLQTLDATWYDGNSTGDTMSRMTNDIDALRMVIGPAIMYTANTVFTVPMVLWYMAATDWPTALAGLSPMLLMPVAVKLFGARVHDRSREQQDQLGNLTTFAQENLAGVRVLKAYAQEQSATRRFERQNELYIDKSLGLARVESFFFPTIRILVGSGMLAILYLGAHRIVAGSMNYGGLVSIVMYFGMLVWPLVAMGWVINLYQRAGASMDRLNEILRAEPKVKDAPGAGFALPRKLDIEFRDLTFSYEGASRPALKNVSLAVPEGRSLGIVGRVGSGKSTLIHLLLRLYPVPDGAIFLGGVDINRWPLPELRRAVGIVFQETFLFSDTIGENIRFGALRELGDGEVEALAREAGVHDDVAGFPKGYETMLGERGINLSGGQKQRVSLARTLARDSRVLILDDSLSAVDTHTEERILGALREHMRERTVLMVSHRISTVATCDEIVVLEDGAATQRGTHEELLARPGLYAELHRRQLLEEEVESA